MKIWAVGTTRNEADIIRLNVLHHLAQGIDRFIWLDNDSSDGTPDVLTELSRIVPLEWRAQPGPFMQHELLTALAQEAYVRGADWVLPLDADEFWYAPASSIRAVLEAMRAGAVSVDIVNFVQRRDVLQPSPSALLTMTRRPPQPYGTAESIARLVEDREIAYVEAFYPPKWIARASAAVQIGWGNHTIHGTDGTTSHSDELICLHAPLRARALLHRKIDAARTASEVEAYMNRAWHIGRWRRLAEAGELDREWAANSYDGDALDLHGRPRPMLTDQRLHDLLVAWVERPAPVPSRTPLAPHFAAAHADSGVLDERVEPAAEAARRTEVTAAVVAELWQSREREQALRVELDTYGRMLAANEHEIHSLIGALDNATIVNASLQAQATALNGQLAEQVLERDALERTRRELAAQLEAALLRERAAEQERQLNQQTLSTMRRRVDALAGVARELAIIRETRSWRWSAPLRALYDRLSIRFGWNAPASCDGADPPPDPPGMEAASPLAVTSPNRTGNEVRRRDEGPRTLIVSDFVPTPDWDSGSFRLMQIIAILRELGHDITFVSDSLEERPLHAEALRAACGLVLYGPESLQAHLRQEGGRYTAALVCRPGVAAQYMFPIRAHAPNARVIYDAVDLHWLRTSREAALRNDPALAAEAAQLKALEAFACESSDVVLAITPEERAAMQQLEASLRIELLPNIHPEVPAGLPLEQRAGLFFIGGFWHRPNVDAMHHFVDEVLPRIRRRLPAVELVIAGSNAPPSITGLSGPGVRVVGYVADAAEYFRRARVFVAPLRFGAGMKGKVGESMSHGLPVVTTAIGAEGLLLEHGETALIADDAPAFAEAVVRIYTDPDLWNRIAHRSAQHIAHHFSVAAARTRVRALFAADQASNVRADTLMPV